MRFYYLLLLTIPSVLFSQSVTLEDYRRADAFRWTNLQHHVYDLHVTPQWYEDNSGFWYSTMAPEGRRYYHMSFETMTRQLAFDHARLADSLNARYDLEARQHKLALQNISLSGDTLKFRMDGFTYVLDRVAYGLSRNEVASTSNNMQSRSPDGSMVAFTKDQNLFIRRTADSSEVQLSFDGRHHFEYGSYYGWFDKMEGEMGKRPDRFAVSWSPDSKYIATRICDTRTADKMYMLDWSVDSLYRPRLLSYFRASPGDTNVVYYRQVLFDVATGREIAVEMPPTAHFNSPSMRWLPDGEHLLTTHWERGYKTMHIGIVDAQTGNYQSLYTEESPTNVDNGSFHIDMAGRHAVVFTSERSGWNQLYHLDLTDGTLHQLTGGAFYINDIVYTDTTSRTVFFSALGANPGAHHYFAALYKVQFDGTGMQLLTPEHAHHDVYISPDGQYIVDNRSTLNDPTNTLLRDRNGTMVATISSADISGLQALGWKNHTERFAATARDDSSTIYGAIWKPTGFDPTKSYPVIDHSYTGPHTAVVPQSFRRGIQSHNQALAELGFVVVMVDGLGSARRSKAFHDWSYKNLGGGLADHVTAIKQYARTQTWIDTTRVGIFGHSAGGYDAAHGLLAFPDFYKVGVASSADHDHRMEKAWWPEMYMGWPVDSAYHLQSNITMAPNLKGKLLITHGGLDDNVNASATFKLAEALILADREFDLLILPSQRHGYNGSHSKYFIKKRWNYFIRHLLNTEPIWDYQLTDTEN